MRSILRASAVAACLLFTMPLLVSVGFVGIAQAEKALSPKEQRGVEAKVRAAHAKSLRNPAYKMAIEKRDSQLVASILTKNGAPRGADVSFKPPTGGGAGIIIWICYGPLCIGIEIK
jgi:hypothetical protein